MEGIQNSCGGLVECLWRFEVTFISLTEFVQLAKVQFSNSKSKPSRNLSNNKSFVGVMKLITKSRDEWLSLSWIASPKGISYRNQTRERKEKGRLLIKRHRVELSTDDQFICTRSPFLRNCVMNFPTIAIDFLAWHSSVAVRYCFQFVSSKYSPSPTFLWANAI